MNPDNSFADSLRRGSEANNDKSEGGSMNLLEAAKDALSALEESFDLVRTDYETNWRHGIPTRAAQLNAMLSEVEAHATAIDALRAAIEAEESAKIEYMPITDEELESIWESSATYTSARRDIEQAVVRRMRGES